MLYVRKNIKFKKVISQTQKMTKAKIEVRKIYFQVINKYEAYK